MPSYATCHIFAATVQRVTSDAVAHIIDSALSAYRWGAQGAAPLRMYHAPFPSSLHRVADELRTTPPAQLFEALCQAAVDAHNTAALAYVFGFCTNYALSRVTSHFLDEQADRLVTYMPGYSAAARRQLAASDIDGIMIDNYIDTSPADYAAYRLLNAEAPDCTAAARVLAQAVRKTCDTRLSPAAVYRGMHDMRHILHLAHNGTLVRGRLQRLERLLGKRRTARTVNTARGRAPAASGPSRSVTCSMQRSRSRYRSNAPFLTAISRRNPWISAFFPRTSTEIR